MLHMVRGTAPDLLPERHIMKFDAYFDPGHGWVRVPRALLNKLGIQYSISKFSYERGDMVYLEEDMDYGTFHKAMYESGRSVDIRLNRTNRRSKIRSYDMYTPRNTS